MKRLLLLPFIACSLQAAVKLHPLFTDGAVLQRDQPVPVWGTASPGEKVEVSFAGQTAQATADAAGKWSVTLTPLAASSEPSVLTVRGENTVSVPNVVVGDVWLASGQSNMASPMSSGSAANALPEANDPLLRFFTVAKDTAAEPKPEPSGKWDASTPDTAKNFSAVAYFFARDIRKSQNVPVGIIHGSWGGTPIKTWMPLAAIQGPPPAAGLLNEWNNALAKHEAAKNDPQALQTYYADRKAWETDVDAPYREARKAWDAQAAAARAAGQPVPPAPQPARPKPESPDPMAMPAPATSDRPSTPTVCYNAMIASLIPYGLKGALWYQGEADASRGLEYRDLLPRLITGWRTAWNQGEFPFLIVQLPGNGKDSEPVASQGIAWLREAQDMALKLPNTGMAVTADIGDVAEVHPDNKVFTGSRLALVAREVIYKEPVVGVGPRYRDHTADGKAIRLNFDHVGGGLVIGEAPWVAKGATPLPTDKLVGFYIAGNDKKWVEADAVIDGNSVVVSAPSVAEPVAVRYSWANTPRANLYNKDGLPAAPFRTDDWPR